MELPPACPVFYSTVLTISSLFKCAPEPRDEKSNANAKSPRRDSLLIPLRSSEARLTSTCLNFRVCELPQLENGEESPNNLLESCLYMRTLYDTLVGMMYSVLYISLVVYFSFFGVVSVGGARRSLLAATSLCQTQKRGGGDHSCSLPWLLRRARGGRKRVWPLWFLLT